MRILNLPVLASILFFTACNDGSGGANPNEKDSTDVKTEELSDADFDQSVQQLDAKATQDTSIHYTKATGQGQKSLATLVMPEDALTNCTGLPGKIEDLNSGSGFSIYKFTSSNSASAKAFGFEGSIGKKELLIIQDYVRFKNVTCNGETKKLGIGLRCFIHVKGIKGKLGGALSSVAASVELDRASGEFNIVSLGFGIGGDVVGDLPTQGEYNVDNFGNLAIVFNNVLKTLKDKGNVVIDPVVLP
jgi:hypothetical protein